MLHRAAHSAAHSAAHFAARGARHAWWPGIALALMIAAPRPAFAHAHLVKSAPAAGAHLSVSPTLIQLWFSEGTEAAMTKITVTGPNGTQVATGAVTAEAGNPLLMSATINGTLPAGEYSVSWRTVAKDGHPSSGAFAFVVQATAASVAEGTAPNSVVAGPGSTERSSGTASDTTVGAAQGMDVEAPVYVFARWLSFAAIIAVVGVAVFRMLIIPAATARGDATRVAPFVQRATQRAATLGLIAGAAALIAALLRLYAERAVIGTGIAVGTILQSSWGHAWLAQFAIAVVACIAFALARRSNGGSRINAAWIVAALAAIALGATPALSGHAIAAAEYRGLSVTLDVVHVLAAGGWLGGLFALTIIGVPVALAGRAETEHKGAQPGDGISLVARLVAAFSPIALVLAGTVIVSGGIAAWLRVGSLPLLFSSDYGTVLLVKLGFVVLVIAGGAFNWLRMRDALARPGTEQSALDTFHRSAWAELMAAMLVIAATAVLVATQPPVH
jgi:copper transport protein